MTSLAGHDLESLIEAFDRAQGDRPTLFIAYTIKGFGLPFAGHKDNHAGLMSAEQMDKFRIAHGVPVGAEWDRFAGIDLPRDSVERFLAAVPFAQKYPRQYDPPAVVVSPDFPVPKVDPGKAMSTQEGFGRVLFDLAGGTSE